LKELDIITKITFNNGIYFEDLKSGKEKVQIHLLSSVY